MNRTIKLAGASVLAILLLALLVLSFAYRTFKRRVDRELMTLFAQGIPATKTIVTEEMLQDLPAPIRRYLTYTGIVGKPLIHTVRLKQQGRFRMGVEQPWMDFRAVQYYTVDRPGFVWDATFYMFGLPFMRVYDKYMNAKGNMLGKLGALFTVVEGRGEGIDQGTMLRYLNEMTWFPSAFLGKNISFTPIDDGSVQVTFTDQGKSVTATLYIDEEGRLTNFIANRYRDSDATYSLWATPMTEYGERAGLHLPIRGKGVWMLPEGDFEYIDPMIAEIEYDVAQPTVKIPFMPAR